MFIMYFFPTEKSPNLRIFLKSRNLKKFYMQLVVDLIEGYEMGHVVVVVVHKRDLHIYTIDFQFD